VAEAGRVIAGTARGIRLLAPGAGTRPLGDRVKQTLFAILAPDLPGSAVLDLCAGSGAAGIEALSRGATRAVFVEREAAVVRAIVENLRRTGLDGPGVQVVVTDAARYLAGEAGAVSGPFDIIVLDPPYAQPALLGRLLEVLGSDASGRLLANGGTVVAKYFWRDVPPPTVGLLASVRDRRFGETGLTFYRREGG
jgi:16S rRNA (guanine966-N2)-methyltransferase